VTGTSAGGQLLTSVEEQTAAALDRLGEALRTSGLGYSDVVVSNVFLRDTRHFQGMNGVYRTYFETDPPTRATVQADLMDPDALIQISVVAARGPKEVITPPGLKSPELPYSWGFKVANTLFISGATSRSPETYEPVPGDVETQTQRIFGNIGIVLEEAGMSFGDLVSCRVFLDDPRAALAGIRSTLEAASKDFGDVESVWVYLADARDWEAVKAVLDEIMGGNMPVPTVVGTRLMGRSGVEIQMIAGG
jgi:enamine deaminase RidA (YjgF/YER057c/UK114 family)